MSIFFQGVYVDVMVQIQKKYAPHMAWVHCIAHCRNLAMQTLKHLSLIFKLEGFLQ
jgi:hypothetical protein